MFFTDNPTRSEFFLRLQTGLRSRMGRDVRGDLPLDYKIVHLILDQLEKELLDYETSLKRRRWIATAGAYFTISFVMALRGNETFMLHLKGLREYIDQGRNDSIPQEDYQRYHILLAPNKSDSGFECRKWLEWLIEARLSEGIKEGPAFCDSEGCCLNQQSFNDELASQLLNA